MPRTKGSKNKPKDFKNLAEKQVEVKKKTHEENSGEISLLNHLSTASLIFQLMK